MAKGEWRRVYGRSVDLEAAAPARFAGGWVEHWPQFQLGVRFKGKAAIPPAIAALIPDDLEIAVQMDASHSLAELLAAQQRIIATVHANYPNMSIGKNVKEGASA